NNGNGNGDTLFQDNFADNSNGWPTSKDTDSSTTIAANTLTLKVLKPSLLVWVFPNKTDLPADVDVTVTVQNPASDSAGNTFYGFGVRAVKTGSNWSFYYFDVTSAGQWEFTAHPKNGQNDSIADGKITGFSAKALNTIRVVAVGGHFDFYFNGKQIGQAD